MPLSFKNRFPLNYFSNFKVLACLGFLSPASRGALMTTALVCYVVLGLPAGYVSARMYKMFGGERWSINVFATALLCPG